MAEFGKDTENYRVFRDVPLQDRNKCSVIPFDEVRYNPDDYVVLGSESLTSADSEDPDNTRGLEDMICQMYRNTGISRFGAFSYNPNDIPNLYSILGVFRRFTSSLGISSSRLDAIARDRYLGEMVRNFGSINITVAIEGISQRIRDFLDKSLDTDEILTGLTNIIRGGFQSVKLYMIFTGMEEDSDVEEFENFLKSVRDICRMYGKPLMNIRISFTPLQSMVGTPVQYKGSSMGKMARRSTSILYKIRQVCFRNEFEMRMSMSLPHTEMNHIMEFGDRRIAPLMYHYAINGLVHTPRFSIIYYRDPVEVSLSEYSKADRRFRMTSDGKYYIFRMEDLVSFKRLYQYFVEHSPFEDTSMDELYRYAVKCEAENITVEDPDTFYLTKYVSKGRRDKVKGCHIKIFSSEPVEQILERDSHSESVYAPDPSNLTQESVDVFKTLIPFTTNGVTYQDMCADKDALYIFPNGFLKLQDSRHAASDLARYMRNMAGLGSLHCMGRGRGCQKCGKCSTKSDIASINSSEREHGSEHYYKVTDTVRDTEVHQRLIVEVEKDGGEYSAIPQRYVCRVVRSAFLQAVAERYPEDRNAQISSCKAILPEYPLVHTMKDWAVPNDNFRDMVYGRIGVEIPLSRLAVFSERDFDSEFIGYMNKHSVTGLTFRSVMVLDGKSIITNMFDTVYIEYSFDDRMVADYGLSVLEEAVKRFQNPDNEYTYRNIQGQGNMKTGNFKSVRTSEPLDKSIVRDISVGLGNDIHKTLMRVLIRNVNIHPRILLSSILGTPETNRSLASIYGVEIKVIGYYRGGEGSDMEMGFRCPKCGGHRLINILSGLPFGEADYEKCSREILCQKCHLHHI